MVHKWYHIGLRSDRRLVQSIDRQYMMNSVPCIQHFGWEKNERSKKKKFKIIGRQKKNDQFEWEQYLYENNNVELSSFRCPPTFEFSLCHHGIFHFTRNGRYYYYYHLLLVETENWSILSQWVKGFQCAYLWGFCREFQNWRNKFVRYGSWSKKTWLYTLIVTRALSSYILCSYKIQFCIVSGKVSIIETGGGVQEARNKRERERQSGSEEWISKH